jgi:hypothetical protein
VRNPNPSSVKRFLPQNGSVTWERRGVAFAPQGGIL